jgi:hypothetical protein
VKSACSLQRKERRKEGRKDRRKDGRKEGQKEGWKEGRKDRKKEGRVGLTPDLDLVCVCSSESFLVIHPSLV